MSWDAILRLKINQTDRFARAERGSMSLMVVAVATPIALLLAAAVFDLSLNLIAQARLKRVMMEAARNVDISQLSPGNRFTEILASASAEPGMSAEDAVQGAGDFCVAAESIFQREFQGILQSALSPDKHAFHFAILRMAPSVQTGNTEHTFTVVGTSDLDPRDPSLGCNSDLATVNELKAISLDMNAAELANDWLIPSLKGSDIGLVEVLGHEGAPNSASPEIQNLGAGLPSYWLVGVAYVRLDNYLLSMFFPKSGVVGQPVFLSYPVQAVIGS